MPLANRFRCQEYSSAVPTSPHCLVTPLPSPPVDSETFARRMLDVGDAYRAAGVAAIYLVHGTFVGQDALGLMTTLGRAFPEAKRKFGDIAKHAIDALIGDAGNYTAAFAARFERAINRPNATRIPVRRFHWSGQNNHIGRADAAVRLIDELIHVAESRDAGGDRSPRVSLWGHSHAGNVFALITNLLAADEQTLDRFFRAARPHFRSPVTRAIDLPVWPRVRKRLRQAERPIDGLAFDLVTFGTPIRYGWDTAGYSSLTHFINHRPSGDRPSHLAPFPPDIMRLRTAADGDLVQQLGIAGTNFAPSVFEWRSLAADVRLGALLEPDTWKVNPIDRLRIGARVHGEGETLLVDYGQCELGIDRHALGHAVYTWDQWMLFHAETMAWRLYDRMRSALVADDCRAFSARRL